MCLCLPRKKLFNSNSWPVFLIAVFALFWQATCVAESLRSSPVPGSAGGQSSVAVGELDGVSANGLETVVATIDGTVSAVRSDGSVLWSSVVPNRECSFSPMNDKLYSSPRIGALFGGSEQFVVIGYGGYRGKACDGGVIAFRGSDGATVWTFSIKKWAKKRGYDAFRNSVYSTPALSDVDGDGKLEVGFGSFDRNVFLLNYNGSVRWYYNAADTVFSSPTFADVSGDSRKELLIGTDISQNTKINPPTPNGGFLYAFKTSRPVSGGLRYLFRDFKAQVWRTEFDQVVQSSPVVAELIADNPGLEIVIGTGCFFPQGGEDRRGKYFRVVSAQTGRVLRTLPVSACAPSTPTVGDLDGDGKNEVVVTVSGASSAGGDGRSHVIAWKPDDDTVVWDVEPKLGNRTDSFGGHYNRSVAIGDLSGDGKPEVIVPYSSGIVVLDGETGTHRTCDGGSCTKPLINTAGQVFGTPLVTDTNGDGRVEVIFSSRAGSGAALIKWESSL